MLCLGERGLWEEKEREKVHGKAKCMSPRGGVGRAKKEGRNSQKVKKGEGERQQQRERERQEEGGEGKTMRKLETQRPQGAPLHRQPAAVE